MDRSGWKVLCESVFPSAKTADSIVLALAYCKARNLDVFKRPVHIVPVWNSAIGAMVETVWPSIAELRTTAVRTNGYAGKDAAEFGPDLTRDVGGVSMTFPAWCRVTLYRHVGGQRCAFVGPQVFWLEAYATFKKDSDAPNSMWRDRPYGQLEKCAEAAALRCAFPEEIGGDHIPEEIERGAVAQVEPNRDVSNLKSAIDSLKNTPNTKEARRSDAKEGQPTSAPAVQTSAVEGTHKGAGEKAVAAGNTAQPQPAGDKPKYGIGDERAEPPADLGEQEPWNT